jgi:hypothetical protein
MIRYLRHRLTAWLIGMQTIAELHPAIFSVSAWSAPRNR